MRIVSGTGRSGTSMWMQILNAAGCTVVGEAFPMDWERRLKTANPEGFFETTLRSGINFTTNPDPHTGAHIAPEESSEWVVKIMAAGLRRTERPFIDRVLVSVRRWPDFVASIERLFELDKAPNPTQPTMSAEQYAAWWFFEHYAVLQDAGQRDYQVRLISYEKTLEDPGREVAAVLNWLDLGGDASAGAAVINPKLRQHCAVDLPTLDFPGHWVSAFDELVDRVAAGTVMQQQWLDHMRHIADEMVSSGISSGVSEDGIWTAVD